VKSTPRRPPSSLFTLAAIVTAVAALHLAREILLPLALATLVSFLLAPLSERLERWGVRRIPSVLAVVSVAFAVLGILGWIVASQLVDLSGNMEKYRANILAKVRAVTHSSETFSSVARTLEDMQEELASDDDAGASGKNGDKTKAGPHGATDPGQPGAALADASSPDRWTGWFGGKAGDRQEGEQGAVEVKVVSLPPSPLAQVQAWLGPLVAPLTTAGIVIVLVLFMLLQREDQRNRLIRLFGASNIHATTEALTDIVDRVSRYLRMQFLINAGYGVCVGTGLSLIGVPNAIMFGVLSFSLRFLPYIGPWISAVLPVAVSLAISAGWSQPIMVVILFVVLELLVNNVAEPLLYGSSIGVSGLGVILSAIFWTWLWGAIGLVLAMPLTVCLVVMARYIPALRFITVMLGDQPTLTPQERVYQRMLAFDDDEVRELATQYLKEATSAQFYDDVLVPALRLAERDRHAGLLSDEQEASVQDAARELVAELHPPPTVEVAGEPQTPARARVLCIPLRDEADKTAALLLGDLLAHEGIEPVIAAVQSLTGELVDAVASAEADAVVVSILPPLPQNDSRLLCRRLRKRYPSLPIIVGFWSGSADADAEHRLAAKGDGEIVPRLSDAVERVRAVASRAPADESSIDSPQREPVSTAKAS
jgi:predicted PurR-regulated permease PerM